MNAHVLPSKAKVDAPFRGAGSEMISIIVPAYNDEKAISNCVESLMQQDYKMPFEVIVIDDGSKDDTGDAAEELGAIVLRKKNAGPAKARNLGAKNAKGEILVFTDSDCVPEKNWLSEMLEPFKDKEVIGVQGAYKTKQKELVARFVQAEIEERYEKMKKNSRKLDWIGSYSAAYRKKDFFDVGGFDESFPKASGEDPELSFKLAKQGKKLVFNPKAIVYHTHPKSIREYFKVKFFRAFYRVKLYSKHSDKILNDSYTKNSIKIQIAAGYFGALMILMIPALLVLNQEFFAWLIAGINTILVVAATIVTIKSAIDARQDPIVALFSLIMIQVRTVAFMLGLPAGIIKFKVLK